MMQITSADLPWTDLNGATVVITGAGGIVATYITETLLFLNEKVLTTPAKVLALVRNRAKAEAKFAGHLGRPDLEFVIQDVSEPMEIDRPVDYIIHAASQADSKYFTIDPAGTIKPNIIGTYHLLELARQSKSRGFLFVSSGEVYGKFETPPTQPVNETKYGVLDPLELRACYGEGKRAGEALCSAWHHQYGLPAGIARLGHTYGPGMDLNDGRVFADFVGKIVRGENIVLKSDGTASRPFCYLADAVTGLFTILFKGQQGGAYNLMNDEAEIRIRDLAELLVGLFPEKGLQLICPDQPTQPNNAALWNPGFLVDTSKIRELGWRPLFSPETGFRRTTEYYIS